MIDTETGEVIVTRAGTDVALFNPQDAFINDAKADAVIELGKRTQDWAAVDRAVDAKLDNQQDLVEWWRGNVRGPGKRSNIPDPGYFVEQAQKLTRITPKQVSKWSKGLLDRQKYRAQIVGAAYRKAMGEAAENHRAEGTGENEWYTPAKYVELARAVLGEIDLDPASNDIAQKVIRATTYYTPQTNGLVQSWAGRVWLNPPYAQPLIFQFAEKMVQEVSAGNVTEAIMLTHNYTDTAWFHLAQSVCAAICFTRGRIAFIDADGETCAPTQGQAFFYYGNRAADFALTFAGVGFVR